MRVHFSYLDRQFADIEAYLNDVREFVKTFDFTLGKPLTDFERKFASICNVPHAIGVNSGTDAISIPLKMMGIGEGDEVITTPMTFVATVGAIVAVGAKPVFVDSEDGYVIDATKIEKAITNRTKAIVPVHYSGNAADMEAIQSIAAKHKLNVVEDACQAIGASIKGKQVGAWGDAGAFSLHPLKNLNVWSDAGMIIAHSDELARKMRLYRNHGLINRDEVEFFGINSRFDTIQAVIGNRLIREVDFITSKRIEHANRYDAAFAELGEFITVPQRRPSVKHIYHLYIIRVKERDALLRYLNENEVEAKIHYPIPLHLQPAARYLGHEIGDFPVCESHCKSIITLPVHQHLTEPEIEFVIAKIKEFYLQKNKTRVSFAQYAN